MPIRQTPLTHTPYAIVAFDKQGAERTDDPDGISGSMSARLLSEVQQSAPTDVFIFSHGWRGDIDSAILQYDKWIDAKAALSADAAKMGPGFKPMRIGIHWPSEPWGDEGLPPTVPPVATSPAGTAFSVSATNVAATASESDLIESYLDRLDLSTSLRARELVGTIFRENRVNAGAASLPPQVENAFKELAGMIGYTSGPTGSDPAEDNAPFDAQAAFAAMNQTGAAFGLGSILSGLLAPFRVLSFWTMKKRARTVGEGGGFGFISKLQQAAPQARIHLIGHSFGCIVVSSICGGPKGSTALPRPIDSLTLLQGAVSLWAFGDKIPSSGSSGYFNNFIHRPGVRGPIITTRSSKDLACNVWYPSAVGLLLQSPSFGINPKLIIWGAIGALGMQGIPGATDLAMLAETADYHFEPGKIYNLESTQYIAKMSGASGAHSDIAGPQVMHALWQAAYTSANVVVPQSAVLTQAATAGGSGTVSGTAKVVSDTPSGGHAGPAFASPAIPTQLPLKDTEMPISFGIRVNGEHLPPLKATDLNQIKVDSQRVAMRSVLHSSGSFGVAAGVNADELGEAGWGLVFAANADPGQKAAILDALKPLLDLRKQQAGPLFHIFDKGTGYQPNATADAWLTSNGAGTGIVNPALGVPYYLMLVGSPADIPFEFQYELDCFFAVGRLYFPDPAEYAQYARNIVSFETAGAAQNKTVAVFNTRNDGDRATALLHDQVALPLTQGGTGLQILGKSQGFALQPLLAGDATKDNLQNLLRGKTAGGPPAVLFTGSHGVDFMGDRRQADFEGALLTQDWPGSGPVLDNMWFSAADVPQDAQTAGMIHFMFACYGAACPRFDTYSYNGGEPVEIAPADMFSRLPQKLLLSGAQAVIGHVDRAWAYSFQNQNGLPMYQSFYDPLVRLLQGRRVGDAMDEFDRRWSVLSVPLFQMVANRAAVASQAADPLLANRWVERDDARNYIVLGDPAVRLKTRSGAAPASGSSIGASSFSVGVGTVDATGAASGPVTPSTSFAVHVGQKPVLHFQEFSGAFDMQAAVSPDCSFQLVEQALLQAGAGSNVDVYIYSISASYLMNLLKEAHDRGASIRVMYDPAQMNVSFANQLRAFGLGVKVAPSHDPRRVFSVCHQKFVVIDGRTLLIESANWAASSIPQREAGQPRKKGNREWLLRVDDKRIAGWYATLFDADWNIPDMPAAFGIDVSAPSAAPPLSFKAPTQQPIDFPIAVFKGQAMRVIPLTSPDNYLNQILPFVKGAQKRIWLQQQYVEGQGGPSVPRLLDAIAQRRLGGVDVRIITSSRFTDAWEKTKNTLQDAKLLTNLRAINLDMFVHCHNKGVIVDDAVVVSSTNWSENSIELAREAGILIHSEAVTGFYASVFDNDWKTSWTVSTADSQSASFSVAVSPGDDTVEVDPADRD